SCMRGIRNPRWSSSRRTRVLREVLRFSSFTALFSAHGSGRSASYPIGAQGRYAAAVSLRGHGKSHGRNRFRTARLSDFLSDVRRAINEFAEPPIILAHSLGALLLNGFLGG